MFNTTYDSMKTLLDDSPRLSNPAKVFVGAFLGVTELERILGKG